MHLMFNFKNNAMKNLPSFLQKTALLALPCLYLCSCAYKSSVRNNNAVAAQPPADTVVAPPVVAAPVEAATLTLPQPDEKPKRKIKIALLLDTSNSMDGLIDQAKAQLWKLVNELALAKYGDEKPLLEIALYEYGNSNLNSTEGFIRQVSGFTGDLDLISEKLFSLRTNGGEEYCGYVISRATQELTWEKNDGNLQVIFIAGNEPFNQGAIDPTRSCKTAGEQDIIVNTIYCGAYNEGMQSGWLSGAHLAEGSYMNIDQNKKTQFIETPYDVEIARLNDQLNDTYVGYGSLGESKKMNQIAQDRNAASYGTANMSTRVAVKTGKTVYKNESWDLVDASKTKNFSVTRLKEEELPKELRGKTKEQKEQYIAQKNKDRDDIIKKIQDLNVKRNAFIAEKTKTMKTDNTLDAAMIKAIRNQASRKNFVFES